MTAKKGMANYRGWAGGWEDFIWEDCRTPCHVWLRVLAVLRKLYTAVAVVVL